MNTNLKTKQSSGRQAILLATLLYLLTMSACGDTGDSGVTDNPDGAAGDADTDTDTDADTDADTDTDTDSDTDTDTDSDTDADTDSDTDTDTDTDADTDACTDGALDCPCDGDACTEGECVDGTCVDCSRGDIGCICRLNGTCEDGAVCGTDGICVACTEGIEFCPCGAGDTCDTGLVCESDICVEDTCPSGTEDCPCDGNDCDDDALYCDNLSICRVCTSDVSGCPCESDDTCLGDNYCDTSDSTCVACPSTDKPAGCACTDSGDCLTSLVCDDGDKICRDPIDCAGADCEDHQVCDDSGPDAVCLAECDGGYEWNEGTGTCDALDPQSCTEANGDPTAEALACEVIDKGCALDVYDQVVCVDTCTSLDCAALHRDCIPAALEYEDATCGTCGPGYEEEPAPLDAGPADGGGEDAGPVDPSGYICVQDTGANCASNDPASIAAECEARLMLCVPNSGGAICEGCISGAVFDPDINKCVELDKCGTDICTDEEYCYYPQSGEPPACEDRCPEGQAYDSGGTCVVCAETCPDGELYGRQIDGVCVCEGDVFCAQQHDGSSDPRCQANPCDEGDATDGTTCTSCSLTCGDDPGERSRVWPFRTLGGLCLCETQQGYFLRYGGSGIPELCDADLDGWINEVASDTYDVAKPAAGDVDSAMLANFRCERREIDRVVQINEYGQEREVGVCGGMLYNWAPGSGPPTACTGSEPAAVVLWEPSKLDDDNAIVSDDGNFEVYGTDDLPVRKLAAAEVNALTKACVSLNSDYNLNGIQDRVEEQPLSKTEMTGGPTDRDLLMAANAHFIELHSTFYEAPASTLLPGALIIRERNRCDASFPVTYSVGRGGYWEGCLRRRDQTWLDTGDRTGIDFGATACDPPVADGTCPLTPPATTSGSADSDTVIDHDLCAFEAAGMLPFADEPWLGMNHSSQFRCFQVATGSELYKAPRTDMRGGGGTANKYDFNRCRAAGTLAPLAGESQPSDPVIECEYKAASVGDVPDDTVGLVAVNYDSTTYNRGCINESKGTVSGTSDSKGWSSLCPGYLDNPNGVLTTDNLGDFGKLICSCGDEYSGTMCEYSCPVRYRIPKSLVLGRLHRGGDKTKHPSGKQSEYSCDPVSGYCLSVPPEATPGFPGGRDGFWMCGEFTASRAVGGDPFMTGSFDEAGGTVTGELTGNVRTVPFVRKELTADQTACNSDPDKCFTLF